MKSFIDGNVNYYNLNDCNIKYVSGKEIEDIERLRNEVFTIEEKITSMNDLI